MNPTELEANVLLVPERGQKYSKSAAGLGGEWGTEKQISKSGCIVSV